VPEADSCTAAKHLARRNRYSLTSSAVIRIVNGTVKSSLRDVDIDQILKFLWLPHGKIGWLFAPEDPIKIGKASTVAKHSNF